MKAQLLLRPRPVEAGPLELADLPLPQPGPGEILVRVRACGVCHTDRHIAEGELPDPKLPLVLGHEIVGAVAALGQGADRFRLGQRVGIPWLHRSCGECEHCRRGTENLCLRPQFTGYQVDGGYAEYALADERYAVPVPARFGDVEAAPLLCAGIVGYRSLKVSGLQPGERLGLYGFGGSAHICIQVARHWGCEVYVVTRSATHQAHARRLGAAWAGDAALEPPSLLDRAILFAPAGWLVPRALGHLRRGGTLAINAIHTSPIPEMPYNLLYHERAVRSVANATRQDAEEFLPLAASIPVRTDTQAFPLAEANRALYMLKRSEINGAGVLVVEESKGDEP